MLKNKRAEGEGKAVAVLILIIALFIALYVLILPPEEREKLLGENETIADELLDQGVIPRTGRSTELFTASPGLVSPDKLFGISHPINAVNLFVKTEPKIINLASSLHISRGFFSKSSPKLKFETKDLKDLNKITFFFTALQPSGILKLKVNGMDFFSEESKPGVKLVEIPTTFLQEKNEIEISVSHPGAAFWKTNEYQLKNVGIKQEFELINSKEERFFTLNQQEKELAKTSKLTYFINCNSKPIRETSLVRIYLNDKLLHSGQTRCVTTNQEVDILEEDLVLGNNKLLFTIDDGDFSFNNINVETRSEGEDFPTYIFHVNPNIITDLNRGIRTADLELFLDADSKKKSAAIKVNTGSLFLNTNTASYEADISAFLKEGSNFIKIVPNTEFNIIGLKVLVK